MTLTLITLFFIYSFLGWLLEVSYYFIKKRHFVNRGFLNGPLCPIYGIGFMMMYILFTPFIPTAEDIAIWHIPYIFILVVIIASFIEYLGGYLLYKTFHTRWWDYSNEKYHIDGFVSLKFSLVWGLVGVIAYAIVHLFIIYPLITEIPLPILEMIVLVLSGLFLVDIFSTITSLYSFKSLITDFQTRTRAIHLSWQNLTEQSKIRQQLSEFIKVTKKNTAIKTLRQGIDTWLKDEPKTANELETKRHATALDKLLKRITTSRLYKAFPDMRLQIIKRIEDQKSKEKEMDDDETKRSV